jgi:SAM-dependent methyltransferase
MTIWEDGRRMGEYEPETYWSKRLESDFTLRGTGHVSYSEAYNEWVYRRKANALRQSLARVAGGGRALDLGSGVGWGVRQLLGYGLKVDGCDITPVAVRRLAETFPEATFFEANLGSVPIPRDDQTFDVVTLLDVAYHITDTELWTATVADVGRLLKPGGSFIVTDRIGAADERVQDHVLFRSRSTWERAVTAAGMRFIELRPLYAWLCRSKGIRGWRRLPDGIRGPAEYALDQYRIIPREPHLRWAVFQR